jgi:hypothetical protein
METANGKSDMGKATSPRGDVKGCAKLAVALEGVKLEVRCAMTPIVAG